VVCFTELFFRQDNRIYRILNKLFGIDVAFISIMEYEGITEKIIGCAFRVFNRMGSGYLESVYERCMLIELRKTGLRIESQKQIQVLYDSQIVGDFVADILVENCIIVELKVVRQLLKIHEAQLVNYLVSTGKDLGLLINFGSEKVQIKRKIRILKD
jgi:GxxExxY protein